MEFIDNIKKFIIHIYSDISDYISGLLQNPQMPMFLFGVLLVIALIIIIYEKT